jgi:hypothetical protein
MNLHQRSIVTGVPIKEIEKEQLKKIENQGKYSSARREEMEKLFGQGVVFVMGEKK